MSRGVPIAAVVLALAAHAHAQAPGPRIAIGGDVLYDAPLVYQLRHRAREVGRARALEEVFSDLAPALREADLAIVNLETPVSPRYRERDAVEDLPVFSAPGDFLDTLAAAGVDAVTVANNHAYDQGVRGLASTLRAAERRSIDVVGAGRDARDAARAVILEHGGARVAVAAWTEGTNHRPRAEEGTRPRIAFLRDGTIASSVRAAREEAHLVVAVFHWTHDAVVYPRPMMRAAAREAAEAGADLVIGHGTHVPGRTEVIETSDGRRVHVLYSLGNLVAAMEEPAGRLESRDVGVRDAPLAVVHTRWRGGRLAVEDVVLRHHWIARPTSAPWLDGGRIPVSRTVSIDEELARLDRAGCGAPCAERASAYRRRSALIRDAMRPIAGEEAGEAVAMADATARGDAAIDAPAPQIAMAVAARAPERRERAEPRATRPDRERGPPPAARIGDSDPRLAPYLRGARVAASFGAEAAEERSIDEREIARVAALMREDRSLRCEVVAVAGSERLAARRARRVMGLVAVRGPSRSRFSARGRAGADEGVTIRLSR